MALGLVEPAFDVSRTDGALVAATAALRQAQEASRAERRQPASFAFPSRDGLAHVVETLAAAIYPRRLGHFREPAPQEDRFVVAKLMAALAALERRAAGLRD